MDSVRYRLLRKGSVGLAIAAGWLDRLAKASDPLGGLRLTTKQKKLIRTNESLHRAYEQVDRCFILACGPSINKMDLVRLKGEFCLSVSNFFVHDAFRAIRPKFHLFAPSHHPITEAQFNSWLQDLESNLKDNTETEVMMSVTDARIVAANNRFPENKCRYYVTNHGFPAGMTDPFNFSKPIPKVQTVAHAAMYLAMYIGIRKIYLVGFDHDMILHLDQYKHFYEADKSKLVQSGYNEWGEHRDLEVIGAHYKNMWQIYKQVKEVANQSGTEIVNVTPGSLLNVFPRESFEDILARKQPTTL
ncbi:MAG: hypothetical protein H6585_04320 [Flavobacteriales bacterium]|nr:hypothetical protein [Flavobacteriales bacterium]MCB9447551.1 hypothetical protein [Flavobacteriales bacterium]